MEEKERYAEHTVVRELPTGNSATKGNYNLADIETKYIPIQTEMISDDKDRKITDLKAELAKGDKRIKELEEETQQLREDLQAKDILVNTYMSVVGTLDNAKQLKEK